VAWRRWRCVIRGWWVGGVRGGRAEVSNEEDVQRRRSPTMKMMEQRLTRGRKKLAIDGAEEEAGVTRSP
jgi:hypothetical protein